MEGKETPGKRTILRDLGFSLNPMENAYVLMHGSLGRLVNHGERKERNCVMNEVHGHLCLFAIRDINIGEELLYDYGLKRLPWQQEAPGESDHSEDDDMPGPQEQPSQPGKTGRQSGQGPQGESDHPGDIDMTGPQEHPSQPEITGSQVAQGPQGESDHPGDNDMTGPQEQLTQPEITGSQGAHGPQGESDHPGDHDNMPGIETHTVEF